MYNFLNKYTIWCNSFYKYFFKLQIFENVSYIWNIKSHRPKGGLVQQFVKLIRGKESGVILGGEVTGGLSIGELTNTLGIIVQKKMTLNALLTAQIGTHPLLTASPAGYPLIKAAENASSKLLFRVNWLRFKNKVYLFFS